MLHIGLDVGSTTVKIAVLDDENNAVYKNYQRHYSDIKKTIAEVLGGCLETIDEKNVTVAVTGSGGISVSHWLGIPFVQEVSAGTTAIQTFIPQKDDGTEPAKEFLDGLDNKMRAKMIRTVELLRDYGYELREPYSKHLNDGIFELRAKVSTDITRVLYFFVSGRKAILTHGFVKKTQKTPQSEIEKADNYRRDYLSKNKS